MAMKLDMSNIFDLSADDDCEDCATHKEHIKRFEK
jgi:hypothetical protein